jgi:hypothetical protein
MKHHVERVSLRDIKLQLVALGATKPQLSKPEIKELPRVLFDNESIKAFILGFYDGGYGMLVATNLRLLFVDVMPFGRVKVEDIPYNMVNSTQVQFGVLFASAAVVTRPNTYRFWWLNKNNVHDFNEYVELQMLKHQQENIRVG